MIHVDLIIPYHSKLQKFMNSQFFSYWRNSYWFPVWYYRKEIQKLGVKIRFLNPYNLRYNQLSKIIGIDGAISNSIKYLKSLLQKLREKANNIVWFDHEDSTGKIRYNILPYVDRYYKRQLLKDRSLYQKKFYNRRLFTDFYARNYNIEKKDKFLERRVLKTKYLQKFGLSWNFAFNDYRRTNRLTTYLNIYSPKMILKYQKPSLDRKSIFSANFKINYTTKSVAFQRKQLLKLLGEKYKNNENISIGYLPKNAYLTATNNSKAIFSPFGYGEICLRDFEAFIAGSALIKPNMDHLETWPNLYKKQKTYISLPWKIEQWKELIPSILDDDKYLLEVAKNGQEAFKKIWSIKSKKEFCYKFIDLITPK